MRRRVHVEMLISSIDHPEDKALRVRRRRYIITGNANVRISVTRSGVNR